MEELFPEIQLRTTGEKIIGPEISGRIHEVLTKIEDENALKSAWEFIERLKVIEEGTQKFDYYVIRKFLKIDDIDLENIYHINISPTTILDNKYFSKIFVFLREYENKRDLSKIRFELTEIEGKLSIPEIGIISNRLETIKRRFGIEYGIDDFPKQSNDLQVMQNIKGISFVKIDKECVLRYINGKYSEEIFLGILKVLIGNIKKYFRKIDIYIEGIETKEVYELIKSNFSEITHFQGYYFGKAVKLE